MKLTEKHHLAIALLVAGSSSKEAAQPEKPSSLAHLTTEELHAEAHKVCKRLVDDGEELDHRIALIFAACREFFTDESWLWNAKHRMSVFQKFRKTGFDRKNVRACQSDIYAGMGE